MTIIINPCGRTGELVRDSLESRGIQTTLLTGPSARKDEPGFLRELKKAVAAAGGVDTIIPVFFPEVLASHRDEFPGIVIMADEASRIRLLDDKVSACELASRVGVPQPKMYASVDDIRQYPVVFKRADGQGGDSVYFPRDRKALDNLLRTASRYLVTDYIEGENVCIDVLRWDGVFEWCAYRVLEPLGKGVSTKRGFIASSKSVNEAVPEQVVYSGNAISQGSDLELGQQMAHYAKLILDEVDYHGVCGLDFRLSQDGLFFLECNPRFSGGLQTTLESGLDLPWLYYQLTRE